MKNILKNKDIKYNKDVLLMEKYIKNGEISISEIKNSIYNELLCCEISNETLLFIIQVIEKMDNENFIDFYCKVKYILSNIK